MPQKPQVRAKKKRRDTRRLIRWRATKALQNVLAMPSEPAPAAQPSS